MTPVVAILSAGSFFYDQKREAEKIKPGPIFGALVGSINPEEMMYSKKIGGAGGVRKNFK